MTDCEECGKQIRGSQYFRNFMGQYFCRACGKRLGKRHEKNEKE